MTPTARALPLGGPISNAWLVSGLAAGPVLVDTGFPLAYGGLLRGIRRAGHALADLGGVLLTHRHSDHAGNAARLQRDAGLAVFGHAADAAVLAGARPAPRMKAGPTVTGLMCGIENRFPAAPFEASPVRDGDEALGLEVIAVPGHTGGSVAFYHHGLRWLFCGDAVLNAVPPLAVRTAVTLPWAAYCDDHAQALASVRRLVARAGEARRTFTGHGPPIEGRLADALAPLLRAAAVS